MSDTPDIAETYATYARLVGAADVDAIVALYADDATIADPVDAPIVAGRDAIRAFYERAVEIVAELALTGPVRISRDLRHGAAPLRVTVRSKKGLRALDVVSVMTFDARGKITSMTAYWGPANAHPL